MKKLLALALPFIVVACGGGGDTVSTMDKIPKIMAPVSESVSSTSVKISQATTGLNLYGATTASFPAGSSRGMCEMTNLVKNLLDNAAQVDKVLCYVQNVMVNNNLADKESVYDGQPHFYTLNFTGNDEIDTGKIRLQITRDGDKITNFSMKNCFGGDGTTQTEYLSYTINPDTNKVAIVSKQKQTEWQSYITVDGELDGTNYKSKTIIAKSTNTNGSNSNSSKGTINQYSNAIIFNGFNTGEWDGNTYSNRAYSKAELLNGTSLNLHDLGLGDGSVSFIMAGSGWPGETGIESWSGDTAKAISKTTGMYYSAVASETPEAVETVTVPDFSGNEVWDCSGTADQTLVVDQASLDEVCSSNSMYPGNKGNNWIDCSSLN